MGHSRAAHAHWLAYVAESAGKRGKARERGACGRVGAHNNPNTGKFIEARTPQLLHAQSSAVCVHIPPYRGGGPSLQQEEGAHPQHGGAEGGCWRGGYVRSGAIV